MTPSLTITAMNEINSLQVGEVKITGTGQGLESGNVVTVKVISEVDGQTWEQSSPIDAQGDWSVPGESESGVDMSGWPLGDVRIEATAKNTNLHVGELTASSTIVDTASPKVLSVTSNPEHPSNGDEVTLTVTFSEPVKGTACLLYTSPSPRDPVSSRMPSSA